MKAIVIGAGYGGLAASVRLASSGIETEIFEQNSFPGGKSHSIEFNGFRFDSGPTVLTMPEVIKDLFDFAGKKTEDYITIKKLPVTCRYFFNDGTIINAYTEKEKLLEELSSKTKDGKKVFRAYFDYAERIYNLTKDIFLFSQKDKLLNTQNLKTLFSLNKIDPFRTMDKANRSFFGDEKNVMIFDRFATYNGSNPFSAPATLNLISYVEFFLGGYYAEGGMNSLSKALHKLAVDKNVKIRFGEKVNKIIADKNRVSGVETDNGFYNADIVISNEDTISASERIKSENNKPRKIISDNELSTSAIVFYWGMKGKEEKLQSHNIIFTKNYEKEFNELFKLKTVPEDPTIYIYISSKFCLSDAPEGHENWYVMINAPVNNGQYKPELIEKTKDTIIKIISVTLGRDIKDNIIREKVLTPETIEKITGSYKGSLYGKSSNSRLSAFLRYPNKSKKYKNLFYCGGSSHPGGGIPLVLLSGKNAAEYAMKAKI